MFLLDAYHTVRRFCHILSLQFLNIPKYLLFIICKEQASSDEAADKCDKSSEAVAFFCLGNSYGSEHNHCKCLAHLEGEGSCSEEHSAPVLFCFKPCKLRNIGDTGLRKDSEDSHGYCRRNRDNKSPYEALAAQRCDQEYSAVCEEADNN